MTRDLTPEEPVTVVFDLPPRLEESAGPDPGRTWSQATCPNCGYTAADVDPEGILWCPACGYSKKGCYT